MPPAAAGAGAAAAGTAAAGTAAAGTAAAAATAAEAILAAGGGLAGQAIASAALPAVFSSLALPTAGGVLGFLGDLSVGDVLGVVGSAGKMLGDSPSDAGNSAYADWSMMADEQNRKAQDAINQMIADSSPEALETNRARAEDEIAQRGRKAQAGAQQRAALPSEAGAPAVVGAEKARQGQKAAQFGANLADAYAGSTALGQAFSDAAGPLSRSASAAAQAGRNAQFQYGMAPGAYSQAYTQAQRNPYDLGSLLSGGGAFLSGIGGSANPKLGSFF